MDAGGQLWEESLSRCENASGLPVDRGIKPPLTAVTVTGEDQVDLPFPEIERIIIGVVAQEQPEPILLFEFIQPAKLRDLSFFEFCDRNWGIHAFAAVLLPEGPVYMAVCGTQAADDHALVGNVCVVEQGRPCGPDDLQICLAEHIFVISEAYKGGSECCAAAEEFNGMAVFIDLQSFFPRQVAEDQVAGDGDDLRSASLKRFQHRLRIRIVKISQQGNVDRAGERVVCLDRLIYFHVTYMLYPDAG